MIEARIMLERSRAMLEDVRARAPGLATAMEWRSSSAVEFRRALGDWADALDHALEQLSRWDGELVRAQAALGAAAHAGSRAPRFGSDDGWHARGDAG